MTRVRPAASARARRALAAVALSCSAIASCHSDGAAPNPCGEGAYPDDRDGTCFCEPGFAGDPVAGCTAHDDLCAEAETRLSHRVCVHQMQTQAQWLDYSLGGGPEDGGVRRLGKFLVPAIPEARLPPVFSDANRYRLHYCLMSVAFEPLFPGLTPADYARLILTRAEREFYAGATYELEQPAVAPYGFSVENAKHESEVLGVDEVYTVYRQLQDRFELGELAFLPRGDAQVAAAASWRDPPFLIAAGADEQITYEVYTPGVAYGRVRIAQGEDATAFGWQDIVVFDEVPLDLEGVMAAAITGTRQDILSHLNVLSAQRGTPNLFVDDAVAQLRHLDGQLVRLEALQTGYLVVPADPAEAQTFWAEHRPLAQIEPPDLEFGEHEAFADIATDTAEARTAARSRYGAKTVGLALLWRLLESQYRTAGLGVPFSDYAQFMNDNHWQVDLGEGPVDASYAETIAAWLADPGFRTDANLRKQKLEQLRTEIADHGVVDPELVALLRQRIAEEFGSEDVMVRVRSSSNTEDTPNFNGAGLYDSASGCAADSGAPAGATVSACDPDKSPKPLEGALKQVWGSLWNFGAFEERDYYQIDHADVAMGATISLRYEDEQANGVAFTGNPRDRRDSRYVVNVQYGETDVVAVTPGVTAELDYLTVEAGEVTGIDRASTSSLVPAGEVVMTDAQLQELGRVLTQLAEDFPIDVVPEGAPTPLVDVEFKIGADGALHIKQARSFLGTTSATPSTCGEMP
jgi:hypothetical protein